MLLALREHAVESLEIERAKLNPEFLHKHLPEVRFNLVMPRTACEMRQQCVDILCGRRLQHPPKLRGAIPTVNVSVAAVQRPKPLAGAEIKQIVRKLHSRAIFR